MLDQAVFTIGRRSSANLRCDSGDVSREHATIVRDGDRYLLRDCGSRYGTYVNGDRIEERLLVNGDCIQLGRSRAMELLFQTGDPSHPSLSDVSSDADLGRLAAVMDIVRALGSGRVLDDVLSLVVDAALDVTKAERGFVMLVNDRDELELTVARGKGRQTLTGSSFATSGKIPREVFETGRSQFVDLERLSGHEHTMLIGIGHVICVPLRVAAIATTTHTVANRARIIGVLSVDGPGPSSRKSSSALSALEAFAIQATLAIESARLYAEEAAKARIDRDLRIAADIQRALLAEPSYTGSFCNLAAASLPCRTIGGDFYDYLEVGDGAFAFVLGDVAGKGPPAALLAAAAQSHFVAQAATGGDPAETLTRINRALMRRTIEARFATMFHAVLAADGRLSYSNGGHEPPVIVGRDQVESLDGGGGPVLGLLADASYTSASVQLRPNDTVVICSDGVTEAVNASGEEFGRARLLEAIGHRWATVDMMLDGVLLALRNFSQGAPQADDITLLVVRYTPPERAATSPTPSVM